MRTVWAATLASVSLAISNGAFAQEATPSDTPDSAPSTAVRLSDAELDEITAGKPITIAIFPPSNASHFHQKNGMTVLILGSGHGAGIFGTIVMDNGQIKTIPGGH